MAESRITKGLNPQQRAAVTAGEGPILVLAGPGSGKTRVLTHRIAYLVEEMDIRAWHIMAVTFTNKAAQTMSERVRGLLNPPTKIEPDKLDGLSIGTFHAICARILRREAEHTPFSRDYLIYDTADQLAVAKLVVNELNLDEKKYNPRAMLSLISDAKNELIGPAEFPAPDYRGEIVRRIYARYDAILRTNNARDFDDLLTHAVWLFQQHSDVLERYQGRYSHILVDEFQDTNMAQYALVKLLADERRNLFAVGDPDQSIYAFRGADYRNVQRFREDFPDAQMILLEQNYRSHQAILDAATGVIDRNPGRVPKALFSETKDGPLLQLKEAYNEDEEAQFVVNTIAELVASGTYNPGEFAVMYRTNAQSRALEDAFLRAQLPYRLVGATRFYARREVKDAMAYLRLIHNLDDSVSLQRVINVPPRGIGQKTLQELEQWAHREGISPGHALLMLLDETVEAGMGGRARAALTRFAALLAGWIEQRSKLSPADLLATVLKETGYLNYLDDGTEEGLSRAENVLELRTVAASYEGLDLTTFLEEVSLVSDVDTRDDETLAPSLLTLHAAKGLEFPAVFIVGLEEGVLPHIRAMEDPSQMQEERRLMYVGITRAKDRLYLLYAFRRSLFGDSSANMPSRFLYDIPENVRTGDPLRQKGTATANTQTYRDMTRWDRAASAARQQQERQRPAPKPTRFKAGACVYHRKYGEGKIKSIKVDGELETAIVEFSEEIGQKTIIADFLSPMEP